MPKRETSNLVTLTNDSSTGSKASMAALSYFDDEIIGKFVSKVERRSPLINRGYFIRVWAVDCLVRRFVNLHENEQVQIVSCGAGFDSLFLRLRGDFSFNNCTFVEADLPSVIERKRDFVSRWKALSNVGNGCELLEKYFLLPCDLRNTEDFFNSLVSKCCFDDNEPTLFLAECVFNYLQPPEANQIIETLSKKCPQSTIIVYEQIHPHDAFGCFMRGHFSNIGSPLSSIFQYSNVFEQQNRYQSLGWKNVFCFDMSHVYRNVLSADERRRIDSLEPFDEYEMWHLKCSHYVLSIASLDEKFANYVSDDFKINSLKTFNSPSIGFTSSETLNDAVSLQELDTTFDKTEMKRFGHRCAVILNDNYVVICGGLGQDRNGRHRRLTSLIAVNLTTYRIINLIENAIFERCYHSFTSINPTTVFLFGGRKSPKEPLADGYLILFSQDCDAEMVASFRKIEINGPAARWRHASCCLFESSIFICGGLIWPYSVLKDCWIVDLSDDNFNCTRLADMPSSLHSHFCCSKQGNIYVYGGLTDADDGFSRSLFILDLKSNSWTFRSENCLPQGIYGHSGHMLDDDIVLVVGGVWENGQENHGIFVDRLHATNSSQLIRLPLSVQNLSMMTNHCSIWRKNKCQLIVTGGGGNCFSFGTLLNSGLVIYNFSPTLFNSRL